MPPATTPGAIRGRGRLVAFGACVAAAGFAGSATFAGAAGLPGAPAFAAGFGAAGRGLAVFALPGAGRAAVVVALARVFAGRDFRFFGGSAEMSLRPSAGYWS